MHTINYINFLDLSVVVDIVYDKVRNTIVAAERLLISDAWICAT